MIFRMGRKDETDESNSPPEGRLPHAEMTADQ
jgi:hypothetical protein